MALRFFAAIYSFSLLRELLRLEVLLEGNCEHGSLEHCGLNHRGFLSSNSGIIEKKYMRYPKKQKLCESHHCSTGLTTIKFLSWNKSHNTTRLKLTFDIKDISFAKIAIAARNYFLWDFSVLLQPFFDERRVEIGNILERFRPRR